MIAFQELSWYPDISTLKHQNSAWLTHCVKSVQIQTFFLVLIFPHSGWTRWISVFIPNTKIRTRKNSVFGHFSRSECYNRNALKKNQPALKTLFFFLKNAFVCYYFFIYTICVYREVIQINCNNEKSNALH